MIWRQQTSRLAMLLLLSGSASTVIAEPGNDLQSPSHKSLRLNQIQVIGSHNSFKSGLDPKLLELMVSVVPNAQEMAYGHPSLTDQLNLGLRGLELDIYHDPDGGRYAKPLGQSMVKLAGDEPQPYDPDGKMLEPGFKVLHIPDIDFRSTCHSLAEALKELLSWSRQHPGHLPVIITCNLSDSTPPLPGATKPVEFDPEALQQLDELLLATLGREKLILPDQVRGEYETLETAILESGWPLLSSVRGRFLLVLDDYGRKRQDYLAQHPGLRGRVMFVNSRPGHPEAAVMIRNNPRTEGETIKQLVSQGYLVRTRADANTREARKADFSRFEAAQKSGAQVISTDYYLADWRLNSAYRVRFKRGACCRVNPVTTAP